MSISLRRVGLLGALVIALVAVVAVVLATTSRAASKSDTVTLSEFKVSPSPKSITHGRITFTVRNKGDMEHELVILKTSTKASKLKVANNRASDKGEVGEIEDVAAGKSKKQAFTLKKGHYVLLCNVPGHYKAGMFADLTVK